MNKKRRVPLLGALLLLLAAALAAALVPAAVALDRRVSEELRRTAVEDLGRAPMILEDRNAARAEALSMHAMTVAMVDGLQEAVGEGRFDHAGELARGAASMYGEDPVVVAPDGRVVVGPELPAGDLDVVRGGETWVGYVYHDGMPRAVGLMALGGAAGWRGAAGSSSALGPSMANTLAGLSRADVTVLGPDGTLVATTLDTLEAERLVAGVLAGLGTAVDEKVSELALAEGAYWVARGELAGAGSVLFSRRVSEELAALPGVRRGGILAGLLALVLALVVGALVALALTRPVRALALAADRVSEGDFEAPVPGSRLEEIDRLGDAFRSMRENLKGRLAELADANDELEERQRRLTALQAEIVRQDRLSSSARMAAELAHEIRNPVANVRNCLEVVRRGLEEGTEGQRFADMAIDELLRMHELAEHLLDLNRPAHASETDCRPREVAKQVAALAGVGEEPVEVDVVGPEDDGLVVAMPPDALKQILFNLVENAREASDGGPVTIRWEVVDGVVRLAVEDDGPGIPDEAMAQLFDPFFTTKGAVHGVGLGLFIAEGLARRYGGRMDAENRTEGGARFRVDLPADAAAAHPTAADPAAADASVADAGAADTTPKGETA